MEGNFVLRKFFVGCLAPKEPYKKVKNNSANLIKSWIIILIIENFLYLIKQPAIGFWQLAFGNWSIKTPETPFAAVPVQKDSTGHWLFGPERLQKDLKRIIIFFNRF